MTSNKVYRKTEGNSLAATGAFSCALQGASASVPHPPTTSTSSPITSPSSPLSSCASNLPHPPRRPVGEVALSCQSLAEAAKRHVPVRGEARGKWSGPSSWVRLASHHWAADPLNRLSLQLAGTGPAAAPCWGHTCHEAQIPSCTPTCTRTLTCVWIRGLNTDTTAPSTGKWCFHKRQNRGCCAEKEKYRLLYMKIDHLCNLLKSYLFHLQKT